jgi:putative endonuclease
MPKTHFFYIAECADGSLYCGYTNDLARREAAHNEGKGAKYTAGRSPVRIVYSEGFGSKGEALTREAEVKRFGRKEKLGLVGAIKKK